MPLPNDTYFDTEIADEPQSVLVRDLRGKYISADNQLLFSTPPELQRYSAPSKKHQGFFSSISFKTKSLALLRTLTPLA